MDCKIRATSPENLSPAGTNTHVIPSRSSAPTGETGREAEDLPGVIYMSSRPLPPRHPAEADGEAEPPAGALHTCHPAP